MRCMSPEVALSRGWGMSAIAPLSGDGQTSGELAKNDVINPEQKYDAACNTAKLGRKCGSTADRGSSAQRKSVPVTRLEDRQLLTIVEGIFVKVALATEVGMTLARGLPHRPAARFNRSGQDALYLSPDEQSARVVIYVRPNDPLRIIASYEVERCTEVRT